MKTHSKLITSIVFATLMCCSSQAFAGISFSIGATWGTKSPVIHHHRSHRYECKPHYWHHRDHRTWIHQHRTHCPPVVIHKPCPPLEIAIPKVCPKPEKVTVWITNSNGSKIAIQLTRRGCGYVGPRREYYHHMPSNEQLRAVYGF